jgi:hypothetical protein
MVTRTPFQKRATAASGVDVVHADQSVGMVVDLDHGISDAASTRQLGVHGHRVAAVPVERHRKPRRPPSMRELALHGAINTRVLAFGEGKLQRRGA